MDVDEVVAQAREDGVRLIRFLYCDPSGIIRGKNVHIDRLGNKIREGVGLTRAQNAVNMLEQYVPLEGMEPVGEIRVTPDPDTYTVLPIKIFDWANDSQEEFHKVAASAILILMVCLLFINSFAIYFRARAKAKK